MLLRFKVGSLFNNDKRRLGASNLVLNVFALFDPSDRVLVCTLRRCWVVEEKTNSTAYFRNEKIPLRVKIFSFELHPLVLFVRLSLKSASTVKWCTCISFLMVNRLLLDCSCNLCLILVVRVFVFGALGSLRAICVWYMSFECLCAVHSARSSEMFVLQPFGIMLLNGR